jgi:hypothetical protein
VVKETNNKINNSNNNSSNNNNSKKHIKQAIKLVRLFKNKEETEKKN